MTSSSAARWTAEGKTSLDDWPMLTWSLGWAPSPARLAITSLAFMFEEVPEPVWKTSTGNWSSCCPSAIALLASAIRSARSPSSSPRAPFASAAAPLIRPSQRTTGTGTRSPETGKFSTALVVSPPHSFSAKVMPPSKMVWDLERIPREAPVALPVRPAGVEAFAVVGGEAWRERLLSGGVAGGDGEAAEQVGVDAFAVGGPALGGAEQVTEPEGGVGVGLRSRFRVQAHRRIDERFADLGELPSFLVGGEAVADRRLAAEPHLPRRVPQRLFVGRRPFEAGNR